MKYKIDLIANDKSTMDYKEKILSYTIATILGLPLITIITIFYITA